MEQKAPSPSFVPVFGWLNLIGASLAALIAVAQNIAYFLVIRPLQAQYEPIFQIMGQSDPRLSWLSTVIRYTPFFVFGFLFLTLVHLVMAIGFMKRKEWARIGMIVILGLWILGGLVFMSVEPFFLNKILSYLPQQATNQIGDPVQFRWAILLYHFIFILAGDALLVWFVWNLRRPRTKEQFQCISPLSSKTLPSF